MDKNQVSHLVPSDKNINEISLQHPTNTNLILATSGFVLSLSLRVVWTNCGKLSPRKLFEKIFITIINVINIVTNLTRTLQSSHFLGCPIFYLIFKNGDTSSTLPPFLGGFSIFLSFRSTMFPYYFLNAYFSSIFNFFFFFFYSTVFLVIFPFFFQS